MELTFKQQANSIDNNYNQMNIIVYQIENDEIKCKNCGEIIHLPIIDIIRQYNIAQKEKLIGMKNQIDYIINSNNINDIKKEIKLIQIILGNLLFQNEKYLKDVNNSIQLMKNTIGENNINKFEIIKRMVLIHMKKVFFLLLWLNRLKNIRIIKIFLFAF